MAENMGLCPSFCTLHVDGAHVGEFDGSALEDGYHVYARPTQQADGTLGVEVAVVKDDGDIVRVSTPLIAGKEPDDDGN